MPGEFGFIDASNNPELSRLAKEVRESKKQQVIKVGDEEMAILSPITSKVRRQRTRPRASSAKANEWLLRLIDLGAQTPPSDQATDVSANVDKYLAQAYYDKSHPPKEQ
jgi:hypothetical protein